MDLTKYELVVKTETKTSIVKMYEREFVDYSIIVTCTENEHGGRKEVEIIPNEYPIDCKISKPSLKYFATGASIEEIEAQAERLVPYLHESGIKVI